VVVAAAAAAAEAACFRFSPWSKVEVVDQRFWRRRYGKNGRKNIWRVLAGRRLLLSGVGRGVAPFSISRFSLSESQNEQKKAKRTKKYPPKRKFKIHFSEQPAAPCFSKSRLFRLSAVGPDGRSRWNE